MTDYKPKPLKLGTNVVAELLPHGRPLLLVDVITAFDDSAVPVLRAARHITSNEPIFNGHFDRMHLWPGIYTQEGLGQCCYLLYLIRAARRNWCDRGGDPDAVLKALENLERGTRMRPGFDPEVAHKFAQESTLLTGHIGLSSAVDLKFLQPVFAGSRLDYTVSLVRDLGQHVRFEVLAEVEGVPVARGTMTSFVGHPNPAQLVKPL